MLSEQPVELCNKWLMYPTSRVSPGGEPHLRLTTYNSFYDLRLSSLTFFLIFAPKFIFQLN